MVILIAFFVGVAVVFGGAMLVQFVQRVAASKQHRLEAGGEQPAPVVPLEDLTDEIHRLMQQGQKIAALKLVRTHTGWGLKEAKAYVENLEQETSARVDTVTAVSDFSPAKPTDWQAEMVELLEQGRKIPAIKLTREKTGLDLKRSKEYVEDQQRRLKEQKIADVQAIAIASLDNPRITSQLELMDYMEDCFHQNQKSLAIQEMVKLNGISQDSAMRQVEIWWDKWKAEGPAKKIQPRLYNQPCYDSEEELLVVLRGLLTKGQKIAAIKQARGHFGMSLKEAKDYVEAIAK